MVAAWTALSGSVAVVAKRGMVVEQKGGTRMVVIAKE